MNVEEWREIAELRATGMSISGIAERLHTSRNTVRRALSFDSPPSDHRPRAGSSADAHIEAIRALALQRTLG